jgi:hypothetical protein
VALADAGLRTVDVDGLLFSNGASDGLSYLLQQELGLRDLTVLTEMALGGTSAIAQVQSAATAIAAEEATTIVCVHRDTPVRDGVSGASVYRQRHINREGNPGSEGWESYRASAARLMGTP